jgi:hypothetical protein
MTGVELDELSSWLSINHRRPNWELIGLLAKYWPDVKAAEINQAWQSMSLLAMDNFESSVEPIGRRTVTRSNDNKLAVESD